MILSRVIVLIFALTAAPAAFSTMIKVTDTQNPHHKLLEGQSYSIVHDLTDNGVPDHYSVKSARLNMVFSDDFDLGTLLFGFDIPDVAKITATGLSRTFEVGGKFFGLDVRRIRLGQDSLNDLNHDGLLEITVTAANTKLGFNDFWWKQSKLTAKLEKVDVPAPGTLALLGLGLAGLGAATRRRRRNG